MTRQRDRVYPLRLQRDRSLELSRRQFLELVASSAAVSYMSGCSQSRSEPILPYTRQPTDVLPGVPTDYATSFLIDGYATGLIARSREGRPVKIEGNPEHPSSLGATSALHQASVWQLYDPDRASAVAHHGQPSTWPALLAPLSAASAGRGERLRLLLEPTSSPLVHSLLAELRSRLPASRVTFFAPLRSPSENEATRQLFGSALAARYDLSRAQLIVALDSDLLGSPHDLRHARAFARRRQSANASGAMPDRLYAIEAALSITGGMADQRLARPSSRVLPLTAALAAAFVAQAAFAAPDSLLDARERRFLDALIRDLRACPRGQTLIVPGERQPPEVHVLAHALNVALGNLGQTLTFSSPALPSGDGDQALPALLEELRTRRVDTLLVLGGNPAYDAPADLDWAGAVKRVQHGIYCGPYENETAQTLPWFGPLLHPFECWGDGRAHDGTLSIAQPLIRPLVAGKSASELLAGFSAFPGAGDHARLRIRFGASQGERVRLDMSPPERVAREDPGVRADWERLLSSGFAPDSAYPALPVTPRTDAVARAALRAAASSRPAGLELNFLPSPTLHDGRFANTAWLLELPEPITKLTWDNAVLLSAASARKLGLGSDAAPQAAEQPIVELRHGSRVLRAPALIAPGHADDSVSIWLGYGRRGAERLARGVGVDAYRLRTSDAPHFASGVRLTPLSERQALAITQRHRDPHGRPLALATTAAALRADPHFTAEYKGPLPSLLPESSGTGPQWAMTIDLSSCSGCNACVVACQAENNVLVVGKEQVLRGREMHWLRIDSYTAQDGQGIVHQPMLCQHCEKAPCEYVCPVNATVHSADGLNEMVYNRCIGTRFCSNNCPYKVRRFNWLDWKDEQEANRGRIELQRNPEVTLRDRGVMEKCSYCVQRIRNAEIEARKQHRPIAAGEVVSACQQACPSNAISFGSLEHKDTPVVKWREQARSYAALHETGAKPRTMYLARIDNPNPELET